MREAITYQLSLRPAPRVHQGPRAGQYGTPCACIGGAEQIGLRRVYGVHHVRDVTAQKAALAAFSTPVPGEVGGAWATFPSTA